MVGAAVVGFLVVLGATVGPFVGIFVGKRVGLRGMGIFVGEMVELGRNVGPALIGCFDVVG